MNRGQRIHLETYLLILRDFVCFRTISTSRMKTMNNIRLFTCYSMFTRKFIGVSILGTMPMSQPWESRHSYLQSGPLTRLARPQVLQKNYIHRLFLIIQNLNIDYLGLTPI